MSDYIPDWSMPGPSKKDGGKQTGNDGDVPKAGKKNKNIDTEIYTYESSSPSPSPTKSDAGETIEHHGANSPTPPPEEAGDDDHAIKTVSPKKKMRMQDEVGEGFDFHVDKTQSFSAKKTAPEFNEDDDYDDDDDDDGDHESLEGGDGNESNGSIASDVFLGVGEKKGAAAASNIVAVKQEKDAADTAGADEKDAQQKKIVVPYKLGFDNGGGQLVGVVEAGTEIPFRVSKKWLVPIGCKELLVYEGKKRSAKTNYFLGQCDITDLMPVSEDGQDDSGTPGKFGLLPGNEQDTKSKKSTIKYNLKITYTVNADGALHVAAEDEITGKKVYKNVKPDYTNRYSFERGNARYELKRKMEAIERERLTALDQLVARCWEIKRRIEGGMFTRAEDEKKNALAAKCDEILDWTKDPKKGRKANKATIMRNLEQLNEMFEDAFIFDIPNPW